MKTPAASSTSSAQLLIRDLTTTYRGGVNALRGVDLTAGPGVYGLLGPNGAGKSTLLRTLATLQVADSGTVRFGNLDAAQQALAFRHKLGYLPQQFGVYPGLSAHDLLDYFAKLRGLPPTTRQARIQEVLAEVNLTSAAHRTVDQYSGGMLRRFGLAAALLGAPELLVVDEPTAGLDPEERVRCLELLHRLGQTRTVILSTHLVEDIASICTRVGILVAGSLRCEGTVEALLADLVNKVWEVPTLTEVASLLAEGRATRLLDGQSNAGVHLRVYCPEALPNAVPVRPRLADLYALTVAQPQTSIA